MLKLEAISSSPELDSLLSPKKEIFDLVEKINGSMLEFHKNMKTSKDIEDLAARFFLTKEILDGIKARGYFNQHNATQKIKILKNIKVESDDFI